MEYPLNHVVTKLNLGVGKPFKFIHISDNHICLADEREEQKKQDLAKDRCRYFTTAMPVLEAARDYANKNNTFVAHTGDLIDFISEKNYEYATEYASSCDLFMAAGNHEFANYLGEHEDAEYKSRSSKRVNACFKNDIFFDSKVVNGINLIAIDNSYHQFEAWQLDRLKAEVKKGMPILLFMHTPLYDEETYDYMINKCGNKCAFLMNVPDELVDLYDESLHYHHRATEVTKEAHKYILEEPLIKAVFAGHIHHVFESKPNDKTMQFVVGGGAARIVEIE